MHFTITSNTTFHIQFVWNNIELIYSTKANETSTEIRIPIEGAPRSVNRHMIIDIEKSTKKSLSFKSDRMKIRVCGPSNSRITQLIIGNQTLFNEQAFYSTIRWLLNTQDKQTGCWFIHIQRKSGHRHHHQYSLRMPWCSAMAQGSFFVISRV